MIFAGLINAFVAVVAGVSATALLRRTGWSTRVVARFAAAAFVVCAGLAAGLSSYLDHHADASLPGGVPPGVGVVAELIVALLLLGAVSAASGVVPIIAVTATQRRGQRILYWGWVGLCVLLHFSVHGPNPAWYGTVGFPFRWYAYSDEILVFNGVRQARIEWAGVACNALVFAYLTLLLLAAMGRWGQSSPRAVDRPPGPGEGQTR